MDFNNAAPQQSFDLIPRGTIARVRLIIRPGGYSDPDREWTGGYATCNAAGAVYLNCEFVVRGGLYDNRRVWSLIGLHSPKGATWGDLGRSFMRAILDSARGFAARDESSHAVAARSIASFAELDGIEFIARIDVAAYKVTGQERNVIRVAITRDHRDYPQTATAGQPAASAAIDALPAWAR